MADAKDQDDSVTCYRIQSASEVLDARQADRAMPITFRKRSATVPLSPSAQDPICLDAEEEKNERISHGGFLECCKRNTELTHQYPNNSRVESKIEFPSPWMKIFKPWKKRSIKCLTSFPMCGVPKKPSIKCCTIEGNPILNDYASPLTNFTLSDLQSATNNFSDQYIIGRGGYSEVYKGLLRDGMLVAVKRLTKGAPDELTECFLTELGIAAHIDHPNTAKLIGCCIEGGMYLVFHLSPLGSLGSHLRASKGKPLNWSQRYKIAVGTADGLTYLHEYCQRRIIHRDIKADNILLTEDFEPQICDFGLAKWLPSELTCLDVSRYEGTPGYFSPEYIIHGIVNEKTDVYAFGVLLLELITGRKASDKATEGLVAWAKPLLDNNGIQALLDPTLGDDYDQEEVDRVVLTASLCIEQSPILRPRMSQAVVLLRGDDYALACGRISEADYPEGTLGRALAST